MPRFVQEGPSVTSSRAASNMYNLSQFLYIFAKFKDKRLSVQRSVGQIIVVIIFRAKCICLYVDIRPRVYALVPILSPPTFCKPMRTAHALLFCLVHSQRRVWLETYDIFWLASWRWNYHFFGRAKCTDTVPTIAPNMLLSLADKLFRALKVVSCLKLDHPAQPAIYGSKFLANPSWRPLHFILFEWESRILFAACWHTLFSSFSD